MKSFKKCWTAEIQTNLDTHSSVVLTVAKYNALHLAASPLFARHAVKSMPIDGLILSVVECFPGMVYRHIVSTVPDFLRTYFYNALQLLSVLMQTGNKCIQNVLSHCAGGNLNSGLIMVLQTAGRAGTYNPHLHIILTEGGIASDNTWRTVSYIPFLSFIASGSIICFPWLKNTFKEKGSSRH